MAIRFVGIEAVGARMGFLVVVNILPRRVLSGDATDSGHEEPQTNVVEEFSKGERELTVCFNGSVLY